MVMSERYERKVLERLEELLVLNARDHGDYLSEQSRDLLDRIREVLNAEEAIYKENVTHNARARAQGGQDGDQG